jgi:hypothetical protein
MVRAINSFAPGHDDGVAKGGLGHRLEAVIGGVGEQVLVGPAPAGPPGSPEPPVLSALSAVVRLTIRRHRRGACGGGFRRNVFVVALADVAAPHLGSVEP